MRRSSSSASASSWQPSEDSPSPFPAPDQSGVPTTGLVQQVDTSIAEESAFTHRDVRVSVRSTAAQTAGGLGVAVGDIEGSSHGADCTGRCLQQQSGFPQATTTTPESTMQPQPAQPISMGLVSGRRGVKLANQTAAKHVEYSLAT